MKNTITEDQEKLLPEIQKIVQEEHQYVLDNLEEFEGLSEGQIGSTVLLKIRKRCEEELNMDLTKH